MRSSSVPISHTLIGFRPGVHFVTDERTRAFHPWGVTELGPLRPETLSALLALQERVIPKVQVAECGEELVSILQQLCFLLSHHISFDDVIKVSVTPISRYANIELRQPAENQRFRLSRFAFCRRADRELIVESPLSFQRVVLRGSRLGILLSLLSDATTMQEIRSRSDGNIALLEASITILNGSLMLDTAQDNEDFEEDRNEVMRQWEFHDLLFHGRSRLGRHDYRYGLSFPFQGEIEPQAVLKQTTGPMVDLHKPPVRHVDEAQPTLGEVMESRRSRRASGAEPITIVQLSELLYRTARIRTGKEGEAAASFGTTSRPYPTGGACYELELYPIIVRCEGIEPGAYHYDPGQHRLCRLGADKSGLSRMLADAALSMGRKDPPDILIAVSARFQRVSWKYSSLAYALTLKNVGVLYQTLYLVATEMELAACALGGGDTDLAGRTLGIEFLSEGCVGEFAIGSLSKSE